MKPTYLYGSDDGGLSARVVDGSVTPDNKCAVLIAASGTLSRWRVDLGALYRVFTIAVHFPTLCTYVVYLPCQNTNKNFNFM
jgi:hypothetical protein